MTHLGLELFVNDEGSLRQAMSDTRRCCFQVAKKSVLLGESFCLVAGKELAVMECGVMATSGGARRNGGEE